MKTPTKQPPLPRYEVLVVSIGTTVPLLASLAPDVAVMPMSVPPPDGPPSRLSRHTTAVRVTELAHTWHGNALLIDSAFEEGLDSSREVCRCPVLGSLSPALSCAALLGPGTVALLLVVDVVADADALLLAELASLRGARVAGVLLVPRASLAPLDAGGPAQLADAAVKKFGGTAACLAVWGVHWCPAISACLRAKGDATLVIDATLAALSALDGLMRQGLSSNRRFYPLQPVTW